jgi:hypothetical protein
MQSLKIETTGHGHVDMAHSRKLFSPFKAYHFALKGRKDAMSLKAFAIF